MQTIKDMIPAARNALFNDSLSAQQTLSAVSRFIEWLDRYGEESYDFQTYYASDLGRWAKQMYYRHHMLGTCAVLPMVFSEALVPSAKRLFWKPQRFPIADAHYAMGFALLAGTFGQDRYYTRALHFLEVLKRTRCTGYANYCWGYPFHWETIKGTIPAGTPLITTVPYVYEAFQQVYRLDHDPKWREVLHSIAEHVFDDYKDLRISDRASSCSYTPYPEHSQLVVNANAYRAYLLTNAAAEFSDENYQNAADRNLNFVLEAQNPDGSWCYAVDGKRPFVDHIHTCFVMKAIAKIEALTGNKACTEAIERGVGYYVNHLFDQAGIPKPFARAPRFTVYRRELYDYAEAINLAMLLQGRFSLLDKHLATTLDQILKIWQRPDGSFRSRRLYLGWDNTPMHRWAASQLFRSLCFVLSKHEALDGGSVDGEV